LPSIDVTIPDPIVFGSSGFGNSEKGSKLESVTVSEKKSSMYLLYF
jgi:hypothetical protein